MTGSPMQASHALHTNWRLHFAFCIDDRTQHGRDVGPQPAPIAQRAETAGIGTLYRSDHYESFPGPAGRRSTDAWATIAGLVHETTRLRHGTMVSPATFRHPGSLAKVVATIDEMSGGRVELGIGAGWHEEQHRRHRLDLYRWREHTHRDDGGTVSSDLVVCGQAIQVGRLKGSTTSFVNFTVWSSSQFRNLVRHSSSRIGPTVDCAGQPDGRTISMSTP